MSARSCTVRFCQITGVQSVGISLLYTSDSHVYSNNVTENKGTGILLDQCTNNTVTANAILYNGRGIHISRGSLNNVLSGNIIGWNGPINAQDDGVRNYWNMTGAGNYWSDCTGSTYSIPGDAGSVDYHAMPVYETRVENGNIVPVTTSASFVIYGGILAAVAAVIAFLVLKKRRSL